MKFPFPRFSSIRQKLFAGVLLTSLVALLISGASLFVYDLHSYRESSSTSLQVEAQMLGYGSTGALQFDDRAVAAQNLAFLKARPTIRAAAIFNPRGAVFASYTRPGVTKAEIPALPGVDGVGIQGVAPAGVTTCLRPPWWRIVMGMCTVMVRPSLLRVGWPN